MTQDGVPNRVVSIPPTAGCLRAIEARLPELDGVRQAVARYILSDPWRAQGLSIVELAERAGVSENAVSRFTRAIGYEGYRDFAQALSLDLGRSLGVAHSHPVEIVEGGGEVRELPEVVSKVFELEIACLRDTMGSLERTDVEQAASALAEAGTIVLAGTGSAAAVCQLAHYRFSNLGLRAAWTADPMVMVSEISHLGKGDVLVAISHSGRTRVTLEATRYARERGLFTIAITAERESPLGRAAELPLVVFDSRISSANAQFGARVAAMVLLEGLASAVAAARYDELMPVLERMSRVQARLNNLSQGQEESGPVG